MKRYMEPWKETHALTHRKQQLSREITRQRQLLFHRDEEIREQAKNTIAELQAQRNSLN